MATAYILYNKRAGKPGEFMDIRALCVLTEDKAKYIDVTGITNYPVFLSGLEKDDYIILAGGDGTLNHFINNVDGIEFSNDVLYFPNGTGNDFAHDMGYEKECDPFSIKEHLSNLPSVTVNGKKYKFINGVGFGIDGYCCQVGDKLREVPNKKVNYTSIAIKGLLYAFNSRNAKITVDGEKPKTFKNVWIAPTMNGRFYGGGMMPTPDQKRNSGKVSAMIFHCKSKLKTLMIFPSLFKGEHIKHENNVSVFVGKKITVEFDRPTPLQIDGETILNVTSYTVQA